MIGRVEHIFMESTGCTIEQHDRNRSSSITTASSDSTISDSHSESSAKLPDTRESEEEKEERTNKVTLNEVHALRDDAWRFKKTEETLSPINSQTNSDNNSDDCEEFGGEDEKPISTSAATEPNGMIGEAKPKSADTTCTNVEQKNSTSELNSSMSAADRSPRETLNSEAKISRKRPSPCISGEDNNTNSIPTRQKMSFATILN